MKRLLIYSHDTFGLGNIRRMLAISQALLDSRPGLSILLVTGSPVIHSLRLPEALDYIKLPCLTRTDRGEYSAKYLSSSTDSIVRLRSELLVATVRNFDPDLLIVDKKPLGVKRELAATFEFLRAERPATPSMLILRDVLDRPQAIIDNWDRNGHYEAIRSLYDRVLILGQREIFDPIEEYDFPRETREKVAFCGYLRKDIDPGHALEVRRSFAIGPEEKLLLVTPGGGEDGYLVIDTFLRAFPLMAAEVRPRVVIVSGPEMATGEREGLKRRTWTLSGVTFLEFSGDMMGLMGASDGVISMGGYNTICEILSLRKRAIVIPRVRPTEEQLIRAERMAPLGLFGMIHPDHLTPERLALEVDQLIASNRPEPDYSRLDLNGLEAIGREVDSLLRT